MFRHRSRFAGVASIRLALRFHVGDRNIPTRRVIAPLPRGTPAWRLYHDPQRRVRGNRPFRDLPATPEVAAEIFERIGRAHFRQMTDLCRAEGLEVTVKLVEKSLRESSSSLDHGQIK